VVFPQPACSATFLNLVFILQKQFVANITPGFCEIKLFLFAFRMVAIIIVPRVFPGHLISHQV
jgi:hypothetical protein